MIIQFGDKSNDLEQDSTEKVVIEVDGDEEDLEYLLKKLNFNEINLIKKNQNYYIETSCIQNVSNIHEQVSNFIQDLNKILNLDPRIIGSLKVKDIVFNKENKKYHASSALIPTTLKIIGPDIGLDYKLLFKHNYKNEKVRDILIFLSQGDDWYNYYKIYETIRKDIVKKELNNNNNCKKAHQTIAEKGWTKKVELDRFYCTAHNFEYAGYAARHARGKQPRKDCKRVIKNKQPMNLKEAKLLIINLFIKWISTYQ